MRPVCRLDLRGECGRGEVAAREARQGEAEYLSKAAGDLRRNDEFLDAMPWSEFCLHWGLTVDDPDIRRSKRCAEVRQKFLGDLDKSDDPPPAGDLVEQADPPPAGDRDKPSEDKTFSWKVNDAALANIDDWAPVLFPDGKWYDGGVYLITSKALKRPLSALPSFSGSYPSASASIFNFRHPLAMTNQVERNRASSVKGPDSSRDLRRLRQV